MADFIVIAVIAIIIISIIIYLYRAKKQGETCVGCPYARQCNGKCDGRGDSRGENQE